MRWWRERSRSHPALVLGVLFLGGMLMARLAGAIPLPSQRPLQLALPLRSGGEVLLKQGWFGPRCVALDLTVRNPGEWPLQLTPQDAVLMDGNEVALRLVVGRDPAVTFPPRSVERTVLLFAGHGGRGELILRLGPEAPPLLIGRDGPMGRMARVTPWQRQAAVPPAFSNAC